jgi:hypothetical protein
MCCGDNGMFKPHPFPWTSTISSALMISSIVHLTHHILIKGLKFCLPLEKKMVHIRHPCSHHWHLSIFVTLAPRTLPCNRWSWCQMSIDRWCLLASCVGALANRLMSACVMCWSSCKSLISLHIGTAVARYVEDKLKYFKLQLKYVLYSTPYSKFDPVGSSHYMGIKER